MKTEESGERDGKESAEKAAGKNPAAERWELWSLTEPPASAGELERCGSIRRATRGQNPSARGQSGQVADLSKAQPALSTKRQFPPQSLQAVSPQQERDQLP